MSASASVHPVIAVTGLQAEARIAAGAGIATLAGGGDPLRLASLLQDRLNGGARAVISFGIAGGLAPGLPAGTVVIAAAVDDGESLWPTDEGWRARLHRSLPRALPGLLAGRDRAVAGARGKAALRQRSGAIAVDMESHIAARLAARQGVAFVALRVVADPAERSLPQAALVGMHPDGSTDILAVLRALAKQPSELKALIHTALDARAAFTSLARARSQLGPYLEFFDEGRETASTGSGSPAAKETTGSALGNDDLRTQTPPATGLRPAGRNHRMGDRTAP